MDHGASTQTRDEEIMTPMAHAVERSSKDVVEFLFSHGKSRFKSDQVSPDLLHVSVHAQSGLRSVRYRIWTLNSIEIAIPDGYSLS